MHTMPAAGRRQRGVALLIFVVLLAIISVGFYMRSVSLEEVRFEQRMNTQKALNQAKQALINYAVIYGENDWADADVLPDFPGEYGFLPCPDYNNGLGEGIEDNGNCGTRNVSKIGYLPWRTLKLPVLKDDSGSCLMYAVSGEYKNDRSGATSVTSNKTLMLNEDTNGVFHVHDADRNPVHSLDPEDRVVAVVFSPSAALPGQYRMNAANTHCGRDYSPTDYLEGDGTIDNASLSTTVFAIEDFIMRGVSTDALATPFNDRMVMITRAELWNAVTGRNDFTNKMRNLAEALAWCIASYGNSAGNRRLPRPAAVDFGGADYRVGANYDDAAAGRYLGRYPHTVDDSDSDIGINAPMNGQPVLFDKGFCNALVLAGGQTVNLETGSGSEYSTLWRNWKDHFFYVVSAANEPSGAAAGACSLTSTDCITVGTPGVDEYAAAVIFSNSRIEFLNQVRNEPVAGDTDTKNSLNNYLEVNNPANNGAGNYTPTNNDIVYCVTNTNPYSVVACP